MRTIVTRSLWTLAIALGIHAQQAEAGVIVDNLSQTPVGNGQVGAGQFEGQEFNTGSQGYTLTSIVANVGGISGSLTLTAELVADNGNTPAGGTVLTTFSVPTIGTSFANKTFDPTTSGVTLAANTNYWFLLSYTSGSGTFGWNYAGTQTASGPGSLGNYATSFNNGASWVINNFGPGTPDLIQVNGNAVPEPSTLSMAGVAGLIGLGAWLRHRTRKIAMTGSN